METRDGDTYQFAWWELFTFSLTSMVTACRIWCKLHDSRRFGRTHAFIWSHTCSPHRSVFHPTKSNIQYMYLIIKTNMFLFHYWFSEVEFTPSGYRKDIWGHEHLVCCNHRVWHKMFTFNGQSAWWVPFKTPTHSPWVCMRVFATWLKHQDDTIMTLYVLAASWLHNQTNIL